MKLSDLSAAIDANAWDVIRTYNEALEHACAEALAAVGGDVSRVVRENHINQMRDVVLVDGKPFRRVEVLMPGIDDPTMEIRIVTTDLTKESA